MHFKAYWIDETILMITVLQKYRDIISGYSDLKKQTLNQLDLSILFVLERIHSTRVLNRENRILDYPRASFFRSLRKEGWQDRELASVPIPPLSKTLKVFLETVRPVLSDSEFKKTVALQEEFQKNEGIKLQRDLLIYALGEKNWLAPVWEQVVYLRDREPLPFRSNYYGLGPLEEPLLQQGLRPQVKMKHLRAALAIQSALEMRELAANQVLEDIFVPAGTHLAMDQYHRLFGTTRIPGSESDRVQQSTSNHFVVGSRGVFVKVEFDPKGAIPLAWLVNTIVTIDSIDLPRGHRVEHLTSLPRDDWAQRRIELLKMGNKEALDAIEGAQFSIILDPRSPDTADEVARLSQLDLEMKWYDLGIQLIIFANGRLSGNLEHSPKDAVVTANLIEKIALNEKKNRDEHGGCLSFKEGPGELEFKVLDLHVDSNLLGHIQRAKKLFKEKADSIDCTVSIFENFGKSKIKSKKMSPDSFIQVALQLTYFRLFQSTVMTYETATLRNFCSGRTETIRSQSTASKLFCEMMENPGSSREDRQKALKDAVNFHNESKIKAMAGEGIDRHLLGLRMLASMYKIKSPFLESEAVRLGFTMATSQTPIPNCYGGGFLPIEKGGFGISYNAAADERLIFMISGYFKEGQPQAHRFQQSLFGSLDAMMEIL
jgi:carnitine O-palmitoyltransferase 1